MDGAGGGRVPFRVLAALACVSAAALGAEILFIRLFSIIQWHHFAYLMISTAMLGYGAAGTAVALLRHRLESRLVPVLAGSALLFALAAPCSFLFAQRLPFNPLEFLWDPWQPLALFGISLALLPPFFCAALFACLLCTVFGRQAGRVYAADLLGAAAGALLVVPALCLLEPLAVLAGVAGAGLVAALLVALPAPTRLRRVPIGRWFFFAWPTAAALVAWVFLGPLGQLRLSPYKELSQAGQVMGVRVVARTSGPLGWLTVLESPLLPFRHAPGLSLAAPSEPPPQLGIFSDGEGMTPVLRFDGRCEPLSYLDFLTSAAAYHLRERPRVLVLGAGAGADVLQAVCAGARSVAAVEVNSQVVDLVQGRFAAFSGRPFSLPGVTLHLDEARRFATASRESFDIVQLGPLDAFGAAAAGLHGQTGSGLYTVEALRTYLARLAPEGVLSLTRWVTLPPGDTLKLFGMAVLALEREGVAEPGRRLVLLRGWRTATLLVKNGVWSAGELERLQGFAARRSFDFGWYPGMDPDEPDRFNLLDRPWFREGTVALLSPARQRFVDGYKFDIAPATDDRPTFFHFFRWRTLPELLRLKGQGGLPLLAWGSLLVAASLLCSLVVGLLLVLLPLRLRRRGMARPTPGRGWPLVYFAAIGLAFMLLEIAFIQKFGLLLGNPLYAVAVTLFSFLAAAGIGSHLSSLLPRGRVILPVATIAAVSLAYLPLLPSLQELAAFLSGPARFALCMAMILPLGLAMGMPLPLGIARLAERDRDAVPWAWGMNACASVAGASAATLLAIHRGFTAAVIAALLLYVLAALAHRMTEGVEG